MGQKKDLNKFMKIALLCAIALVLMYIEFPITPFPWLKIDLSDVPALMGAFAFGPMAGIIIEIVKTRSFLFFLTSFTKIRLYRFIMPARTQIIYTKLSNIFFQIFC